MSAFDPINVRKAVAEFTPRRLEKFQDLIPATEVMAELLTQHCLPMVCSSAFDPGSLELGKRSHRDLVLPLGPSSYLER